MHAAHGVGIDARSGGYLEDVKFFILQNREKVRLLAAERAFSFFAVGEAEQS